MAANHCQSIRMNSSVGQLLSVVRDRRFCGELRIDLKSENPSETGVWFRFHHGVTFTSWGEKITITLTPISEGITDVQVHSECGMPTQIIDWGKNKQNVRNVLEYIQRNTARYDGGNVHSETIQTECQNANKFCHNCGKQIESAVAFCPYCGTKQNI